MDSIHNNTTTGICLGIRFTVSEEPLELNRYDQFEFASDKTDGDSPPELPNGRNFRPLIKYSVPW
jgi:hypothetical protein